MKRSFGVAFSAMAAAFLLSGCPQGTIKSITLSPSQTNGTSQYWYSQNAYCDVSLPGQGLFTNGLGPQTTGPGEAYSGFEDIYNRGADPFPCIEQQQTLYRGQVFFDLSRFDSIGSATLSFNVENSLAENGGVNPQIPAVSNATTLGMSTGTIDTSNGPGYWNYDNDVPMPSCSGGLIQPNCSIEVISQVQSWVGHAHLNFGFVIAGPILNFPNDLPSDNNGNVTWYNNFQLVIVYNTTQNPRAPQ